MKIKKLFMAMLVLIACMAFAASALAAPGAGNIINIVEGYLTVTIPEGYYVLTQGMDESYEFFQDFEADVDAMKNFLVEQKIYLDLFAKDMSHEITVMVQTPEEAGIDADLAFEYDDLPKKYHADVLEAMTEKSFSIQGYTVEVINAEFVEVNGRMWIRGTADVTDANGAVSERLQYSTIKNGMVLNINLFSTGDSSASEFQAEIDNFIQNSTFGTREGYTPPEIPKNFNWTEVARGSKSGVIGAVCALIACGISIGIGKKKQAKKAAEEAARAATARNYHGDTPTMRDPDQEP